VTKPIIVRPDGTLGQTGLEMVRKMASEHKTQRYIAMQLGIPYKKFLKLLERNKGDNAEHLAWEEGFAEFEQRYTDFMLAGAMGTICEEPKVDEKGNPVLDEEGKPVMEKVRVVSKTQAIQAIFFAKTQLGWNEKPTGPMVQDNRIQITVPGQLEYGAMLKALGQDMELDFRKDQKVPLKEVLALSPIVENKKKD
jgi:hypothetical protein